MKTERRDLIMTLLSTNNFPKVLNIACRRTRLHPFSCKSPQSLFCSQTMASSDFSAFREKFGKAKNIVVLTGAGVSAESGVPTFRGAGGLWRKFAAQDLATPDRGVCQEPIPCVGVLPLPPRGHGFKTPKPCSYSNSRM